VTSEERRVRLLALDLDGTLLVGGNRISDANTRAVKDAVEAGVHIVFATSRWYRLAKRTADALGITTPIICHNGAMVRSPSDDGTLLYHGLDAEPSLAIARIADEHGYESMVTVDDVTHLLTRRPDVDPARLPDGMALTRRLEDHVTDGCAAFLFFGQDAVDGVPARLNGAHADVLNLASGYSETFPPYLNIVHARADKGRALRLVCEHVGVSVHQALAIGDAAPDLAMMRAAGMSMAMGNAPAEVKAEATVVGPSNLDDGVAWAIREFAL
jgi:Cof subfamily protein (haloacid dehalogenase superfamily)